MILRIVLSDVFLSRGPRAASYEEILQCTWPVHVTHAFWEYRLSNIWCFYNKYTPSAKFNISISTTVSNFSWYILRTGS